ncbi:UNVERIFIED_CONTAM: hypothetical protein GTU68_010354 [Idotea baltica]|nr:hypothetical protein [Idotea baltica]
MTARFDTEDLLACYRRGVFPMAESQDDLRLFLVDPDMRGILPLRGFHIPSRLKKTVRQEPYQVRYDTAFTRVMEGCAAPGKARESTWINSVILNLYSKLHKQGHAHSVECWDGNTLVGGLYGVSIGGAFFGESMFSIATDASKIALVHLVARLLEGGYKLLDAQFHNPHLEQFGLLEIPRNEFKVLLVEALATKASFYSASESAASSISGATSSIESSSSETVSGSYGFTGSGAVQRITQTS